MIPGYSARENGPARENTHPVEGKHTRLLLFLAGFNLLVLQLLLIREVSIPLLCTELVILMVTVAYFGGHLVGYLVYHRLSRQAVEWWLAGALGLHLLTVPWVRVVCALLRERGLYVWAFPFVFLVVSLFLTSFYALFLPRAVEAGSAVETPRDGPQELARAYATELLGSITALLAAALLGSHLMAGFVLLYQAALLGIAWCLGCSGRFLAGAAGVTVGLLLVLPPIDRWSDDYFFNHFYGWYRGARVIHRVHSPYQKIAVVEEENGNRRLYLNGLEYFNASDLEQFNFYLSEVPARLKPGARVLVVGSGSLSSLSHLAPYASHLTTVEIDRQVAEVGRRFFAGHNRLSELKVPWRLVIDDAKHFLSHTEERFDLVIVDVPAPFYTQTGLLFTREFYQLVQARLAPGGVLSAYLCETFALDRPQPVSGQILAAVHSVFEDLVVVNGLEAEYGFVLAGDAMPFGPAEVAQAIQAGGRSRFIVLGPRHVLPRIAGWEPASYDNLDIVRSLTMWALPW